MPPIIMPGDPTPDEIAERARQIREEGFMEAGTKGKPGNWHPPWGKFPPEDEEVIAERKRKL